MTTKRLFIMLFLTLLTLTACTPKADMDIRGEWAYTMIDTKGKTWDEGTITFSGSPEEGTYLQINIYEVDYEGTYTVSGNAIKLNDYESWKGEVTDANTMNGTWPQEDGGTGTFTATRK